MHNKRDQLHAHLYQVGRLTSAMVHGNPDAEQTPMRRTNMGSVIGVVVGLLAMGGAALLGLFLPKTDQSWRSQGSIIVEKETGTRYLLMDDVLYPTLNVVSARLAAGGESAAVRMVPRAALDALRHGHPVGIPGAPDAVPLPSRLSGGPWLVCAIGVGDGGSLRSGVHLRLGAAAQSVPVPDDQGVLVQTPGGVTYLVWRGHRLRFADRTAQVALGYGSTAAVPVADSWLNALPAGPDLTPPDVPDRGEWGPAVGGRDTIVGQVLEVAVGSGNADLYLVRTDGVAPITRTSAALILADPRTADAYPDETPAAIAVTAGEVADQLLAPVTVDGHPPAPPVPADAVSGSRTLCVEATLTDTGPTTRLTIVERRVLNDGRPAMVDRAAVDAWRVADEISVPGGGGALLGTQSAPGRWTSALYLVTDLGIKYPLTGEDVATSLGLRGAVPTAVPNELLAFLPTGAVLDPEAARTERPFVEE